MISVLFIVYLYRYLCSLICTSSKYQSFVHSFALRSHRQCELPFKQCSYDNHSPQGAPYGCRGHPLNTEQFQMRERLISYGSIAVPGNPYCLHVSGIHDASVPYLATVLKI